MDQRDVLAAGGIVVRPVWLVAGATQLLLMAAAFLNTVGEPAAVSIVSLGFGFVVGLSLRAGTYWAVPIALYTVAAAGISLALGRPLSLSLISAGALAVIACGLVLMGRWLRLAQLRTPRDIFGLLALATASALVLPLVTVANAYVLGRQDELSEVLPQSGLTAAAGLLISGGLVLAYEPGLLRQPTMARYVELVALAGLAVFLLVGVTLMDVSNITGAGPLFMLMVVLGWIGVRFSPFIAALFLTLIAIWLPAAVVRGMSVFVSSTTTVLDSALALQVYLAVTTLGVLMLSVYARHTRDQDNQAVRSAELLSGAVEGAEAELFIKLYDPATDRFIYSEANDVFTRALGLTADEVLGHSDAALFPAPAAARFHAQDTEVFTSGRRRRFDITVTIDGRTKSYLSTKFPVRNEAGEIVGVGVVRLDRTEERRRATLLQLVFTHSPVPTARLRWSDQELGEVLEVNDAFAALVAVSKEDIVGHRLDQVLLTPGTSLAPVDGQQAERREVRLRRRDGVELTVAATSTLVIGEEPDQHFVLVILEDVTAERAAEAGLVHRATHDPLTDLWNRQALVERLASRTAAGVVPAGVVLLCCDLDGFKQINDSLGHDTGDRILLSMAGAVRAAVGVDDTVGRLGADEFVVVSAESMTLAEALALAERVRTSVGLPVQMDGRTHVIGVSIGVAVSTGAVGAEELLRQADVALTRAKDTGRDRVVVYQPEFDRRVQMRVAMRETLRSALSENRIEVHAQPVLDLATGRIVGAEALVRLRDLDGTMLPPAAFIPVAEESGLIVPLGLRVLDLALALRARWAVQGAPLEIAVNVSPRQLTDRSFPATVETLLKAHDVPARQLVLEVTESTVVDALGPTLDVLRRLREARVHVAIDDFGTGYSSLASLRDLPADIVKIDQSFVAGLVSSAGDEAIVRAVLAMAHATGRVVVAEGVETAQQAQRLAELNCDRVQGYLYDRPLAPIDFDPHRHYEVGRVGNPVARP